MKSQGISESSGASRFARRSRPYHLTDIPTVYPLKWYQWRSRLIEFSPFVLEYVGDSLWAAMLYFMFAFVFAHKKPTFIALAAMLFCFAIEFSQLYHAPWIDALRANKLAALVLGQDFKPSDFVCYSIGILIAVIIDRRLLLKMSPEPLS